MHLKSNAHFVQDCLRRCGAVSDLAAISQDNVALGATASSCNCTCGRLESLRHHYLSHLCRLATAVLTCTTHSCYCEVRGESANEKVRFYLRLDANFTSRLLRLGANGENGSVFTPIPLHGGCPWHWAPNCGWSPHELRAEWSSEKQVNAQAVILDVIAFSACSSC